MSDVTVLIFYCPELDFIINAYADKGDVYMYSDPENYNLDRPISEYDLVLIGTL